MSVPAILETHMAIVGTTGAGKTVTGKGYVEQLLVDGRQVVVIDPTGAWWGMQYDAAGDGPGLRIPVFGGLHGNAATDPDDGARVAELLIDERVSAIIDLSEFDEEEQRSFALAFITRMRTKPIGNLHLVIDEADELAPELVPDSAAFSLKRALAWIAKRGRIRGFVLTIITQRPADIAKSVLALAQTMVIHRLIAPQDQAPIDRYLKSHATAATRKEVLGSLAKLQRGERWIYSPVEDVLERDRSPALTTFDSSAAPVPGQAATEPQALADVDFVALAEALASSRPAPDPIAEAEARDPGAWDVLVGRVDRLEKNFAGLVPASEIAPATPPAVEAEGAPPAKGGAPSSPPPAGAPDAATIAAAAKSPRGFTIKVGGPPSNPNRVAPRLQAILDWTHWSRVMFGDRPLRRDLLAQLLGRHPRSKGFLNDLGELRSSGLLEYAGEGGIVLTTGGWGQAHPVEMPATPAALRSHLADKLLTPAQRKLFGRVVVAWPEAVAREHLAEHVGHHPRTKSFLNDLGRLRGLGLLTYADAGGVRAADFLMKRP